jgi:hypothetical protein
MLRKGKEDSSAAVDYVNLREDYHESAEREQKLWSGVYGKLFSTRVIDFMGKKAVLMPLFSSPIRDSTTLDALRHII